MRPIASLVHRAFSLVVRGLVCSWSGHERTSPVAVFCRTCNKRLP